MRWREVETATTLDLEVQWDCDGSTADLPSHRLGIDWDDFWSLWIIRKLDSFKENIYTLQLLQV